MKEDAHQNCISLENITTIDFLRRHWRLFIFPEEKYFMWDSSDQYFVKVSPEIIRQLEKLQQDHSSSLKEMLRK